MFEYSMAVIENYCETHKTKKAQTLARLVDMAYDDDPRPDADDAQELEKLMYREKNEELKEALENLNYCLFGW